MFTGDQIRHAMRLYAVTDRDCLEGVDLVHAVADALKAGITCVQLREKDASDEEFEALARELKPLCGAVSVPFIINDNVELAKRVDADGVHVGQGDTACENARRELGAQKIVGVSVQTVEQALAAQNAGADYLGVGAMYGTPTKPESEEVDFSVLKEICATVDIPVVAIGGLSVRTIPSLAGTGVDGAAVVSAIFGAHDIARATKELVTCIDEMLGR